MNNGKEANMSDNEEMAIERTQVVCPYCGSRNIARIFRGMPAFTEELQRELDEGKVILGGCEIEGDGFILCRAINAMTAKKSSDARGRRRLKDSDKLAYPCWER